DPFAGGPFHATRSTFTALDPDLMPSNLRAGTGLSHPAPVTRVTPAVPSRLMDGMYQAPSSACSTIPAQMLAGSRTAPGPVMVTQASPAAKKLPRYRRTLKYPGWLLASTLALRS